MKKLNVSEVNAIVGGTCTNICTLEYKKSGGVCYAVSTCVDKNGKIISTDAKTADLASCGLNP